MLRTKPEWFAVTAGSLARTGLSRAERLPLPLPAGPWRRPWRRSFWLFKVRLGGPVHARARRLFVGMCMCACQPIGGRTSLRGRASCVRGCLAMPRHRNAPKQKKRKKTDKPNEGWEKDRVPTCTSRILEGRSGTQGNGSGERISTCARDVQTGFVVFGSVGEGRDFEQTTRTLIVVKVDRRSNISLSDADKTNKSLSFSDAARPRTKRGGGGGPER